MKTGKLPKQRFTLRQVMDILGVSKQTLHKWDKQGILPAVRVNVRGDRRWDSDVVGEYAGRMSKNKGGVK